MWEEESLGKQQKQQRQEEQVKQRVWEQPAREVVWPVQEEAFWQLCRVVQMQEVGAYLYKLPSERKSLIQFSIGRAHDGWVPSNRETNPKDPASKAQG